MRIVGYRLIVFILISVGMASGVKASSGVSANVQVARVVYPESFRVQIENKVSGNIRISRDSGQSWIDVGQVLLPNPGRAEQIQDGQFTASDWAPVGGIAATAVNAIHVKVGHPSVHARLFSILPVELLDPSLVSGSYYSGASSIMTNIPAGTRLFGNGSGFKIGDPIFLRKSQAELIPWPADYAPQIGDVIEIVSQSSPHLNWVLEFENRVGGTVTFREKRRPPVSIATVEKPVRGTGRFLGGRFAGLGKVRANHPGVIDVSTSEIGVVGGFQIVPYFHATSPHLAYTQYTPAYMIVRGLNNQPLEGTFPLFNTLIRPGDRVDAKIRGVWQPLPHSAGLNTDSLNQVEVIRIRPTHRYIKLSR